MNNAVPPAEDPRKVLARYGFAPKKSFSQNFLINAHVVERIAEQVVRDDKNAKVIELGPGVGTLTAEILRKSARVHAIEHDRDMLRVLQNEFAHCTQFAVEEGDAADLNLQELTQRVFAENRAILCGNLPYAITGQIFRNLYHQSTAVTRGVFMIQKEVADRLTASPGEKTYGALTACIRGLFSVKTAIRVSRGSFFPVPNVDSAVVVLTPLTVPIATDILAYEQTVRLGFGKRRKTLLNALQDGHEKSHVIAACASANIDSIRRGETLSPEEFAKLAAALTT